MSYAGIRLDRKVPRFSIIHTAIHDRELGSRQPHWPRDAVTDANLLEYQPAAEKNPPTPKSAAGVG